MAHIIPHINTLIFDIGSVYTKVGYAGDFHPTIVDRTITATSETECIIKTIEKYAKEMGTDSFIIVENMEQGMELRSKVLKQIFIRKLCNSILFIKSPVCDAFGHGKLTCTILSCSASSITASTVLNGKVVEIHKHAIGATYLEESINESIKDCRERICSEYSLSEQGSSISRAVLESTEIIEFLMEKYEIDVFQSIRPVCYELIDRITEMRSKYCINKKNASNGCIILSGGTFKHKPFFEMIKDHLMAKLNGDFSDFILREEDLKCTFVGASLFGMNDKTKPLYISSHDFKNIGMDIVGLKSLDQPHMFCECGALIFFPKLASEEIKCRRCSTVISNPKISLVSITKIFKKQTEQSDIKVRGARINVPCPKCDNTELLYNTAQLRSADEGQTVFYTCEKCGYKDTVQS